MRVIHCKSCNKDRRVSSASPSNTTCMRCALVKNKILLHKCYASIIEQPDMAEFQATIEKWYV